MHSNHLFSNTTGSPPYAHQRTFATAPVLPDLLGAPTGSGKTATAMLGWLWRRVHDSSAHRVGEALGKPSELTLSGRDSH